jgi:hypothetical protein
MNATLHEPQTAEGMAVSGCIHRKVHSETHTPAQTETMTKQWQGLHCSPGTASTSVHSKDWTSERFVILWVAAKPTQRESLSCSGSIPPDTKVPTLVNAEQRIVC